VSSSRSLILGGGGATQTLTITLYEPIAYGGETANFGANIFTEHRIALYRLADSGWNVIIRLLDRDGNPSPDKFMYLDSSSGSIVGRNLVQSQIFAVPQQYHVIHIWSTGKSQKRGGTGDPVYVVEFR